nr:hypothetical protein [Mucilaginibacter sp. FT3.2]
MGGCGLNNNGASLKKWWKCAIPLSRGAEGCVYARAMKHGKYTSATALPIMYSLLAGEEEKL